MGSLGTGGLGCIIKNWNNQSKLMVVGGKRNIIFIALAFFLIFFGFGTAQQYFVILFKAQGKGVFALASLFTLYAAFMISGIVAAKIIPFLGGLKKSLILASLAYALFTASIASSNVPLILLASVLIGFAAGILWVSSGQIIADSSDKASLGRNLAYQVIGQYSGNILGIILGSYFILALPMQAAYAIFTAFVLAGSFLLLWIKPIKEELKPRPFRPSYIFEKRMPLVFPLIFGANFLQGQVFTALNLIVVSLLGIGSVAAVITVVKVANIIGSFSNGSLSARYNKPKLLIILVTIGLLGVGLLLAARGFMPVIASALLLGFSMAAIYPVCLAWLHEKISAYDYIYALGVFQIYSSLGIVGAILSNMLLGSNASFIPGIIALAVAIPCLMVYDRRLPDTAAD